MWSFTYIRFSAFNAIDAIVAGFCTLQASLSVIKLAGLAIGFRALDFDLDLIVQVSNRSVVFSAEMRMIDHLITLYCAYM